MYGILQTHEEKRTISFGSD